MREFFVASVWMLSLVSHVRWRSLIQIRGWKFERQWISFKSVLCRLLNCMPIALFGIVFDYSHF